MTAPTLAPAIAPTASTPCYASPALAHVDDACDCLGARRSRPVRPTVLPALHLPTPRRPPTPARSTP